jgi:hypothetical protein
MVDIGVGAGIGVAAFWLFIATVVAAGIWDNARKRESQHETLRRLMESGQKVDEPMLNKLLGADKARPDRDLKVAGLIVLFTAPGLLILAHFLSMIEPKLWTVMLGVAGLIFFIGIGLLVGGKLVERSDRADRAANSNSTMV